MAVTMFASWNIPTPLMFKVQMAVDIEICEQILVFLWNVMCLSIISLR